MTPEFARQIFEKYTYIKFHENPSVGAELLYAEGRTDRQTDRQTERHDEANSRVLKFANTTRNRVHT
jgi:hypothetical protein